MYVVRRVWDVKPSEARLAASLVDAMGRDYEATGKRSPSRVYFNNGTLPGDRYRVYMEWTEETIDSPYRDAQIESSEEARRLYAKLRELTVDSWIEFYELLTPEKAMSIT
jgi:hypothetical protein